MSKGLPKLWLIYATKDLVRTYIGYEYVMTNHSSVPHDYEDLLSYYTKRGYRVIAIAGKSVDGLSWLKAQRMKRYLRRYCYAHRY